MAYSYYNDSGKLVSGAAATSHKIYKVHGGPAQFWLGAAAYAVTGLVLANLVRKGVHALGDTLHNKEEKPL